MPARQITKYPNRRLYDTGESRYVTLQDIRTMVLSNSEFTVVDRQSGADITRQILLQVITELERTGESLMSRDFLSEVIRSYGHVVPEFAANYLEQSMRFFRTQHQNLRNRIRRMAGTDPFAAVADLAHRNIARWRSLQDEVLSRFAASLRRDDGRRTGTDAGA